MNQVRRSCADKRVEPSGRRRESVVPPAEFDNEASVRRADVPTSWL